MDDQETAASIEVERPVTDPEIALALDQPPAAAEEPANPDAWLQWALIIGLLALFLICAILIFIAWNGR